MTVGDIVVLRTVLESAALNGPPNLGVVNAEPGGTDALVFFRNGQSSQIPQTELRKVFAPAQVAADFLGKWAQMKAFPESPDGPPKTPAAAGVVLDIFGTADYGAGALTTHQMLMSSEDAEGFLFFNVDIDATVVDTDEINIFVQDGRRNV